MRHHTRLAFLLLLLGLSLLPLAMLGGARVRTTQATAVWGGPEIDAPRLGTQAQDRQGLVVAGPAQRGTVTLWLVWFDDGLDGWVDGQHLTKETP
jgi:hypothetical protein